MQQRLQIPGDTAVSRVENGLTEQPLWVWVLRPPFVLGHRVGLFSSTCSSTVPLPAVFYYYLLFETPQLVEGCRRAPSLFWLRLCGRHSPYSPPQAASVGSGRSSAPLPGPQFLLSLSHLQWLFTNSPRVSRFALPPTLRKLRLLSTLNIHEEERGGSSRVECLVPRTWLYFPCPELQHKGLLRALSDLVCESLVKKESAGVCGLLKFLFPQGFCAVPPAALSLRQCVRSCSWALAAGSLLHLQ